MPGCLIEIPIMTDIEITFTDDCTVLDHNKEVAASFKAGKSYKMVETSSDRWLRRGKARLTSEVKANAKAEASK